MEECIPVVHTHWSSFNKVVTTCLALGPNTNPEPKPEHVGNFSDYSMHMYGELFYEEGPSRILRSSTAIYDVLRTAVLV